MSKKPADKSARIKGTCFRCRDFKEIAVVMHGHTLCERCYDMTQKTQTKRSKR